MNKDFKKSKNNNFKPQHSKSHYSGDKTHSNKSRHGEFKNRDYNNTPSFSDRSQSDKPYRNKEDFNFRKPNSENTGFKTRESYEGNTRGNSRNKNFNDRQPNSENTGFKTRESYEGNTRGNSRNKNFNDRQPNFNDTQPRDNSSRNNNFHRGKTFGNKRFSGERFTEERFQNDRQNNNRYNDNNHERDSYTGNNRHERNRYDISNNRERDNYNSEGYNNRKYNPNPRNTNSRNTNFRSENRNNADNYSEIPFSDSQRNDRRDDHRRDSQRNDKKDFRDFQQSPHKSFRDKSLRDKSPRDKFPPRNNYSRDIPSKKQFTTPSVSVEYLLEIISKQINLSLNSDIIIKDLNLNPDNYKELDNKLKLLEKFNILKKHENNYSINDESISENLKRFALINVESTLVENHYIASITSLQGENIGKDDVIIEDLRQNFKDKILVELEFEEEKLIAYPLFYLDSTFTKKPLQRDDSIKGIYKKYDGRDFLVPLNFKSRQNLPLVGHPTKLIEGSLIKASLKPFHNKMAEASFIETISEENIAKSASMLSIYQYNLPYEFPEDALKEAQEALEPTITNRTDIRHLPLVTIDDEDAKDFDDAIYAQKCDDDSGAYMAYIAIADVSYYVAPNSALDKEAQKRGNSVYLSGLVIPMLPKELSNGWCSLNPNENRGCLLATIRINRNGEIEDYSFAKGLMKSSARLTYKEVKEALLDDNISENIAPLMETTIKSIFEVYELLNKARIRRKALEINSQETKIILDKEDNIVDIVIRPQYVSHKIVEEFMIAANVSSAKFLAKNGQTEKGLCTYRVHDKPNSEKVFDFINTLKSFNIFIKSPPKIDGEFFNKLLRENSKEYFINSLNESILRCQAQAVYDNFNIGHFGLNLKEYCHFTSPIRRYSDLLIHRLILAVIDAENNKFNYSKENITDICSHISTTERTAFNAENSTKDRILAKWLQTKIGEKFEAYISSITHAGMFINLTQSGASGLIPMRFISMSYATVDIEKHIIYTKDKKLPYKLGDKVEATLTEADNIRGLLTFSLIEGEKKYKGKKDR